MTAGPVRKGYKRPELEYRELSMGTSFLGHTKEAKDQKQLPQPGMHHMPCLLGARNLFFVAYLLLKDSGHRLTSKMGVRTPDGLDASKLNILQEGLGKHRFLVICRAARALRPSRQICGFPLETQEKNKIISIVTRVFLIWYVLRFFSRRLVGQDIQDIQDIYL